MVSIINSRTWRGNSSKNRIFLDLSASKFLQVFDFIIFFEKKHYPLVSQNRVFWAASFLCRIDLALRHSFLRALRGFCDLFRTATSMLLAIINVKQALFEPLSPFKPVSNCLQGNIREPWAGLGSKFILACPISTIKFLKINYLL